VCGHCGIIVSIPSEVDDPLLHAEVLAYIRDHRYGHIAERILAFEEEYDEFLKGGNLEAVTDADAGPAVEEADAIVRGGYHADPRR